MSAMGPGHPHRFQQPMPHPHRSVFGGVLGIATMILAAVGWLVARLEAALYRLIPALAFEPLDFDAFLAVSRICVVIAGLSSIGVAVLGAVHCMRVRPRSPFVVSALAVATFVLVEGIVVVTVNLTSDMGAGNRLHY